MTLRTTVISTSQRVDFEIPAEMVGKELEIVATEKTKNPSQSLADQYKMTAAENTDLTNEFEAIDLEGWENEY